jgi:DNA-binding MarR family transcriptional regulator
MSISLSLNFFLELTKFNTIMARKFDASLDGVSFNEFVILYYLDKSPEGKLRRVDLAAQVGLTPSGVTRLLLPMEKIGLIKKETNPRDARVSFVSIAPGGKRKLLEALDRAEVLSHDFIPGGKTKKLQELSGLIKELGEVIK